jgi:tripartite-type tricarboxylate transporter receptor subunit TctC
VVNAASPSRTLDEFIAWTRNYPGSLNFGSAGIGSGEHLAYKGSGPLLTALLAGEYQFNLIYQ